MQISPLSIEYREPQDTNALFAMYLPPESLLLKQAAKYGDVWWEVDGMSYGAEMKSCADFLGSLWSSNTGERLEMQLDGLRRTVDFPILAIHGILWESNNGFRILDSLQMDVLGRGIRAKFVAESRIPHNSINNFLWSIAHPIEGNPITVIWRADKEALVKTLVDLYWYSQKPESKRKTFNHVLSKGKVGNSHLNVLMSIEGLGEQTARLLLERFKAPIDVFVAEDEELMKVKGVGKETIKKIREATM